MVDREGTQLVFVYGTLRKGGALHASLAGAECLAEGTIEAELFSADDRWFPLVRPGDGTVIGEVYEVTPTTLERLDFIEGHPAFFERKLAEVDFGHGEMFRAWVYWGPNIPRTRIASGDWMAHLAEEARDA